MVTYRLPKEKEVTLYFAELKEDIKAQVILKAGEANSPEEARHLAQFFWHAMSKSADIKLNDQSWPFDEDSEYWTEKLYNSIGGYFENAGYEDFWNEEIDKD